MIFFAGNLAIAAGKDPHMEREEGAIQKRKTKGESEEEQETWKQTKKES